jgi:uncharacterized protein (DUF39 family)
MANPQLKKAILPTILAGVAVYLGLSRKSKELGSLAKDVVTRVVDHELTEPPAPQVKYLTYKRRRSHRRDRNTNCDRYYH